MGNSVEIAPLAGAEGRSLSGLLDFQGWSLLLLLAWLYHSILYNLVLQWGKDPNFGHGYFVPAFSLYLLWQDRQRLKAIEPAPTWAGLPLIVGALALLLLGDLGVELFTARISLLFLLAGLILFFRGWEFFRAVLFPLAFLILMIPLPNIIQQKFTFPLQLLASKLASGMLEIVHVPVFRQGNLLTLADKQLDVADACSGIRSLYSLVTLAVIYGCLMEKRKWVRVILACAAIPIAILANCFRVFVTGLLVQYWGADKAEGGFHTFEGWLVFVISLILLFALHRLISRIWKSAPDSKVEPAPAALPLQQKVSRPPVATSASASTTRFMVVALPLFTVAMGLQIFTGGEHVPPRELLSSMPLQVNSWTGTDQPIDQQTRDILGDGEFLLRDYDSSDQSKTWINLYIAYFPSQKMGDTIHSPEHCLPGAGWIPIVRQVVPVKFPDGTFPVNRYVVINGSEKRIVLYWFQAHGRVVASEYSAKYYLIADSIRMHRSDGGMVRLMSPMYPGESAEAAQARVMELGDHFLPLLNNYIPR